MSQRDSQRPRSAIPLAPLVLLVSALLAFSMWFFADRVWSPSGDVHFSDLYPSWYGAHELFLHARDPYGPAVTREIQLWAHGHALDSKSPAQNQDGDRFVYPLYMTFVLAPTVGLQFPQVAGLFRIVLPLITCASVPLWLYMLRWRCSRKVFGMIILLSFGSFPVLESIYLQQPALLAVAFMAAAGACLAARRLALAGALLALSTIKPQLTVLVVPWFLFWAVSNWPIRKRLIWGFGSALFLLVACSQLLLPGWISEFAAGMRAYQRYTGAFSILSVYFTRTGAPIVTVALVTAWAFLAWRMRHEPEGSNGFNFTLGAALATTLVIIPTVYPTGQVALLPAIFFLLKEFPVIWQSGRVSRLAYVSAFSLLSWPWLGALLFLIASFVIPIARLRPFWIFPVCTLFLVPVSLMVVFLVVTPTALRSWTLGHMAAAGGAGIPRDLQSVN